MASLTITRGLNQQSPTQTSHLIGFRNQQGIEIAFDQSGAPYGCYLRVYCNGYEFIPVFVSGITWRLDMTSIVTALKTAAPYSVTTAGLIDSISYYVEAYMSNGGLYAGTSTKTASITFAKPNLGGGLYDLFINGTTRTIYHCGKHCIYDELTNSYVITSSTINTAPYVYKQTDGDELAWIDRDGKWSFWNFRKLSETRNAKKTNEVQNYALSNYELKSRSYMLDTELTVQIKLDTICINADHYRQMTEISESERVIFAGLAYNVAECSKTSAECRQNMKFNLVLERDENA